MWIHMLFTVFSGYLICVIKEGEFAVGECQSLGKKRSGHRLGGLLPSMALGRYLR